jgi:UDPglucose 6-dehydrogenase
MVGMSKLKMAIVGHGFVGKAVDYGFNSPNCKKYIVDPKGGLPIEALKGKGIDITFVCVPTPMGTDGRIDSSIIESVVNYLIRNTRGLIVIKSTVTPDIISTFGDEIVYNPEFLTEKSANEDFVNPIMHVFGGDFEKTKAVERIYEQYSSCKPCPVYHMTTVDASFVKYGINSFLATKVLWFNQFYDIVTKNEGNFGKVISAIGSDKRVGPSHTTVPGFDGKRGFGGACFPKDTTAFVRFSDNEFTVLMEVIARNQEYRSSYELDSREMEQNITFDKEL